MFLIPLNQKESVELLVHALRIAGGVADCRDCPARKVCTKQCLAVADGIHQMMISGTLPSMDLRDEGHKQDDDAVGKDAVPTHLRVVK